VAGHFRFYERCTRAVSIGISLDPVVAPIGKVRADRRGVREGAIQCESSSPAITPSRHHKPQSTRKNCQPVRTPTCHRIERFMARLAVKQRENPLRRAYPDSEHALSSFNF
jgi:hypothetical protein